MAPAAPVITSKSIAPVIISTNWLFAAIAIAVVIARHHVRRNIIKRFDIEDYLIFVNLALALTMSALLTVAASYGLGQHSHVLAMTPNGPSNIQLALNYILLSLFFLIMAPCFGRVSYAFLLLSIVGPSIWRKRFLWTIIVLSFLLDFATATVITAQCTPMSSFWKGKREDCLPGVLLRDLGSLQGSFSALVDFTLAVFPATLFWNLRLKINLKISLSVLMGLGIFAMVCSIMETVHIQVLPHMTDPTYELAPSAIWAGVEAYMVLIAASIPTLRPLIGGSQKSNSYYAKRASNKQPSDCLSPIGLEHVAKGRLDRSGWCEIGRHQSSESQKQLHIMVTTDIDHTYALDDVGVPNGALESTRQVDDAE